MSSNTATDQTNLHAGGLISKAELAHLLCIRQSTLSGFLRDLDAPRAMYAGTPAKAYYNRAEIMTYFHQRATLSAGKRGRDPVWAEVVRNEVEQTAA